MSRRKKQTPSPAAKSDGARATPEVAAHRPAHGRTPTPTEVAAEPGNGDEPVDLEAVDRPPTESAAADPADETGDRPPTETAAPAAPEPPEEPAAVTPDDATQAACTVDPPEHYTVDISPDKLRNAATKAVVKHLGLSHGEASAKVATLDEEDVRGIVEHALDPRLSEALRHMFGLSVRSD